ncbi:MAG: 3'-5' exonuclease [Myxococcales bacterium]|nr:3'-5' exonuclease [Myxococcales bacterium]
MRTSVHDVCGCFPTGRHYPGIAAEIARDVTEVKGLSRALAADARWLEAPFAVIDFETTGLSAERDRVLEVGVVTFRGGERTDLKNWLVNPTIPVPEEARAVHNISDDDLKGAPTFPEIVAELSQMLEGHLPVAYNAAFDRGFLQAELVRAGIDLKASELPPAFDPEVSWIDPLVWSRELDKDQRSHKLGDVCERLGVSLDNAHRAASDAEATGRVLLALGARMPESYGELIRIQAGYAARQDVDMGWRRRG